MKIIRPFAIAVSCLTLLLFFSCEEEEDVRLSQIIFGTWSLESGKVNGVASVDTTSFRLTLNVDQDFNPSTYSISARPGIVPPNYRSRAVSGEWRLSEEETLMIFDPNSDEPSVVEVGEFEIELGRLAFPLRWTDENSNAYEYVMAIYEPE